MVGVVLPYILYAGVMNYQGKHDRSPVVAPQSGGLWALVIVLFEEACLQ